MKKINWLKPAYDVATTRQTQRKWILCGVCKRAILAGNRWHRGPRGKSGVHADCRLQLAEKAVATR